VRGTRKRHTDSDGRGDVAIAISTGQQLLTSVAHDRLRGRTPGEIARAFQRGVGVGVSNAIKMLCQTNGADTVVLSGGVFQNELLLEDLKSLLETELIQIWTNAAVPPNDGGISLGQAALAAFRNSQP